MTLVESPSPQEEESEERRYPSTIGGGFYIAILVFAMGAITVAALGHWRLGVQGLALALVVAALLRLVLPKRDAGMLAVRSRLFDAGLLAVVGAAIWILAASLPSL
ncbi:MAG: DUF3017 domain-containing protein [Nocardioides sp.]|uniref:DUF3017 domain-containing protein n=1 Tax=Nocardioides sp. TaxID=35761 RepID=UPI0039E407E0